MSSSYGQIFKISTFGESHGKAVGVVLEGCPAGLEIDEEYIQKDLDRRKPGQSKITTQRDEADRIEILSGVFEGKATGTPIAMMVYNADQRSKDYSHIAEKFRPSHADYTYEHKYGIRDYRGGGAQFCTRNTCPCSCWCCCQEVFGIYGYFCQCICIAGWEYQNGISISIAEPGIG